MKKKQKQNDTALKTAKSTNRLVKFLVFGGIALAAFGIAGGAIAFTQKKAQEKLLEKVYTVEFDLEEGGIKGSRKDDAKGMVAGINGAKNDFDNAYPWKAIKEVKDENGDYFVRIPKFYERIVLNEEDNKLSISIAPEARKGFKLNQGFVIEEGGEKKTLDYFDVAKYEASLDDENHLRSLPGVYPVADEYSLGEYRDLAEDMDNQLFTIQQNLALQTLFTVEFATPDSQGLMSGLTQGLYYKHVLTAEEVAAKTIKTLEVEAVGSNLIDSNLEKMRFIKANTSHLDIAYEHEDEDEDAAFEFKQSNLRAQSVKLNEDEDDIVSISLDKSLNVEKMEAGEEINIWFGAGFYHKTGETDNAKGSSNGASQRSLEVKAMNYRGVENWYGNTFTLIDGIFTNIVDNTETINVTVNPKLNGDLSTYRQYNESNLSELGLMLYQFDNVTEDEPWLYDYFNVVYEQEVNMIGGIGGGFDRNADDGIFCLGLHFAQNTKQASVRLSSIK